MRIHELMCLKVNTMRIRERSTVKSMLYYYVCPYNLGIERFGKIKLYLKLNVVGTLRHMVKIVCYYSSLLFYF